MAQDAGLSPAVIDAISVGKRPDPMQEDEAAIYNFGDELLKTRGGERRLFQGCCG